jgi:hypothetical protein
MIEPPILIEEDKKFNYLLFNSKYIADNLEEIIQHSDQSFAKFKGEFPEEDSTKFYQKYNVFTLTATSLHFYRIYKDLMYCIKTATGYNNPMWFQSWLNYHKQNEVLDWHNHHWPLHGYISIDPKITRTEFQGYEIINKPGNIYIGPGGRMHRVVVDEPYDGNRITLGFDITSQPNALLMNLGLLPI